MNDQHLSEDSNKFRFALGLMVGTVLTLILTWLLSGSSMANENSLPKEVATEYAERPTESKPKKGRAINQKPSNEKEVEQMVILTADKMQVFYLGVDNPLTVSSPNADPEDLSLTCKGCRINGWGNKYRVVVTKPGEVIITVSGNGLPPVDFKFRAKRLPDPVALLGKSSGGAIGSGQFKNESGLGAFLFNFDFEAHCQIQGFELTRAPKREEQEKSVNPGARYNEQSKQLIRLAKPGDTYYFTNVKVKCPGDHAGRRINTLVFQIK